MTIIRVAILSDIPPWGCQRRIATLWFEHALTTSSVSCTAYLSLHLSIQTWIIVDTTTNFKAWEYNQHITKPGRPFRGRPLKLPRLFPQSITLHILMGIVHVHTSFSVHSHGPMAQRFGLGRMRTWDMDGHGEFGDRKTYQPTTTLVPSTQHIWGLFRDVDMKTVLRTLCNFMSSWCHGPTLSLQDCKSLRCFWAVRVGYVVAIVVVLGEPTGWWHVVWFLVCCAAGHRLVGTESCCHDSSKDD